MHKFRVLQPRQLHVKHPVIWVYSPTVNALPVTTRFRSFGMCRRVTGWNCSWHFEGTKCLHLQGWSL